MTSLNSALVTLHNQLDVAMKGWSERELPLYEPPLADARDCLEPTEL